MIQFLGWLAAAFIVLSFHGRDLKRIIVMQISGYLFLAVHFFLLDALTGAVLTLIGIIRLGTAYFIHERPDLRGLYLVFIPVILAASWVTADGLKSLFPAIGYLLGTFAVYQTKILNTRILYLLAHPFWLIYNFLVGSYAGVAMEAFNILSSTTAIYRYRGT